MKKLNSLAISISQLLCNNEQTSSQSGNSPFLHINSLTDKEINGPSTKWIVNTGWYFDRTCYNTP